MVDVVAVSASLLVSLVVNLASIWYQTNVTRREQRERQRETWYQDVKSITRQIERHAKLLPPGIELNERELDPVAEESVQKLEEIDALIGDLENLSPPPEEEETRLKTKVDKLVGWYYRPHYEGSKFTTIDLKEELISRSQGIQQEVRRRSRWESS